MTVHDRILTSLSSRSKQDAEIPVPLTDVCKRAPSLLAILGGLFGDIHKNKRELLELGSGVQTGGVTGTSGKHNSVSTPKTFIPQ